ncbi:MAG: hypothetical protein IV085_06715 [Thiobacillus sp.]|nr:hypothetical protein [Thiobacillus sp.]
MRHLRLFLFVLLSLAVPAQGLAQFVQQQTPCPMELEAMGFSADMSTMHDCCNDADTAAKTGQPCKTVQPCPSPGQFLPFAEIEVLPQERAATLRFPPLAETPFSFDPAATWRPPTQL